MRGRAPADASIPRLTSPRSLPTTAVFLELLMVWGFGAKFLKEVPAWRTWAGSCVCFASRIDVLLFLAPPHLTSPHLTSPHLSVALAAQYDAERVAYGAVIPTRDTEPAPEVEASLARPFTPSPLHPFTRVLLCARVRPLRTRNLAIHTLPAHPSTSPPNACRAGSCNSHRRPPLDPIHTPL